MDIFTLLALGARREIDKAAVEKITQKLNEKYGEEFVVDKIGGGYGTLHTNTLKAIAYPRDAEYKKFNVEITKDLAIIWDSYMDMIMADKLDTVISEMSCQYLDGSYMVKAYFPTGGMTYPDQKLNNKEIPLKDYLVEDTDIIIHYFVESKSDVNPSEQAEKIHSLGAGVLSIGVRNAYINVFYVKTDSFPNINQQKETFFNWEEAYNHYSQKENSYQQTWIRVENGRIIQSIDKIKSHFE